MATAKQTKSTSGRSAAIEAAQAAEASPAYAREELLAHAEALFGRKPEIVAGALHGSAAGELTIDEAKALVDTFMNRKVTE